MLHCRALIQVIQVQYGNLFRFQIRRMLLPFSKISSIYPKDSPLLSTHPFSFHRLIAHNDFWIGGQYLLTLDDKLNVIIAKPDPITILNPSQLWTFNL